VRDGKLRFEAALGLDEAVERICAIPGFGPWTAHYIAMRALGEPDAFPETDIGIRRALGTPADLASVAAVRERAEQWRPWRSYAVIYLWNSLSGQVTSEAELVEEAS
jgi:3-methyladenine DNA glycosylase/8-oxoguanine DNA glycosylase